MLGGGGGGGVNQKRIDTLIPDDHCDEVEKKTYICSYGKIRRDISLQDKTSGKYIFIHMHPYLKNVLSEK